MVEEDIGKRCLALGSIQRGKIDSRICKRLIRWCEDSERPGALKRSQQFGLDDRCYERIVNACCLCRAWNVARRHQHSIYDVDYAVRGKNVCSCDLG